MNDELNRVTILLTTSNGCVKYDNHIIHGD